MDKNIIVLQEYKTYSDCQLLRYANMDLIELVEDSIGSRLLDSLLRAHNNYIVSDDLKLIIRYKKCISVKGQRIKLKNPADRMSFFNTCDSAQWNLKLQRYALANSEKRLRSAIDTYFEKIKVEMRKNKTIMPIFIQSIYAEITNRNDEATGKTLKKKSLSHRIIRFFKFR